MCPKPEFLPGDIVIITNRGANPFHDGDMGILLRFIPKDSSGHWEDGWTIDFKSIGNNFCREADRHSYYYRFRHATNKEIQSRLVEVDNG